MSESAENTESKPDNTTEKSNQSTTLMHDILACKDLSLVLKNRYGKPGRERHALSNILYKEGKFWAKHSMAYAPDTFGDKNHSEALSQSFNNFCDMDCISNLCAQSMQLMTSKSYSEKTFITRGQYRKVWSLQEGGDFSDLRNCVNKGIKLKILVEDHEYYFYIVPMHLIEVFLERDGFVAYSDYDGYPEILKSFEQNQQYGKEFNIAMESMPKGQYARSNVIENVDYFLTMFVIHENQLLIRKINKRGDITQQPFPSKRCEIWAENCDGTD